ncbi:MAG: hypothetical protein HY788_02315 [Deltaproteobacteria bacterium]|nr:hypothetical protein [Deltaproteobacteria bacterium]
MQLLSPAKGLGAADVQPPTRLTLNLFDDTIVTAVLERLEAGFAGLAWIGRLEGISGSEVTLVYSEISLSGSVTFDNASFQIRPIDESLYVIREIDPALARTPAGCVGTVLSNEEEVFNLVNQERAANSLSGLNCDDRLVSAARNHSEDMAENDYFDHTSLDGRAFSVRITEAGYIWNYAGENIAAGYSTPQTVMNGWMNSSGHRANILEPNFCDLGVGYAYGESSTYGHYWTQDFGRQMGVSTCDDTPPPPPPPSDPVVSGTISTAAGAPVPGVLVTFSNGGGTVTTNVVGFYSRTVPYNWSGAVTPSRSGYTFNPVNLSYQNLTSNRSNQNFQAQVIPPPDPVVSGAISTAAGAPVAGVLVTFSNGAGTATTDASGFYSRMVPYNWSGAATPSKDGYTFDPNSLSFVNLTSNRSNQNFQAQSIPSLDARLLMILSELLLGE